MLSTRNLTKKRIPGIAFSSIAEAILGPNYELSLVFTDSKHSRTLNNKYRGKDKPTNVLSFPLSPKAGEILIDVEKVREELASFGTNFATHLGFLFIHGALHLKGYDHGSTMEAKERLYSKRFLTNDQTHRNRTRRRHSDNTSSRL